MNGFAQELLKIAEEEAKPKRPSLFKEFLRNAAITTGGYGVGVGAGYGLQALLKHLGAGRNWPIEKRMKWVMPALQVLGPAAAMTMAKTVAAPIEKAKETVARHDRENQ